jgi:hypothetical protein
MSVPFRSDPRLSDSYLIVTERHMVLERPDLEPLLPEKVTDPLLALCREC